LATKTAKDVIKVGVQPEGAWAGVTRQVRPPMEVARGRQDPRHQPLNVSLSGQEGRGRPSRRFPDGRTLFTPCGMTSR
jgi:hypothetical protein